MEVIIYKVIAERMECNVDMDMCPYESLEIFYEDLFPNYLSAVRKAQKIHARHRDSLVRVVRMSVTKNGMKWVRVVYRKAGEEEGGEEEED